MPRDYWDIKDILAFEESLDCRFSQSAIGLGHLDPLRSLTGRSDLPVGSLLHLPLWMVVQLTRMNFVQPLLPERYGIAIQSVLRKGSEGARFGEKSRNFFKIGLIIAWLVPSSTELAASIFHGVLHRIKFLIDQSAHACRGGNGESEFVHRLTEDEEFIYSAGVSSNELYDKWRHGAACEIKPHPEMMSLMTGSLDN